MDDWRIKGIAVCAGIEDAVSGVGEEIVEGVERFEMNKDYLKVLKKLDLNANPSRSKKLWQLNKKFLKNYLIYEEAKGLFMY